MNRAVTTSAAGLAVLALTLLPALPACAGQQPTEPGWPQPEHNNPMYGYAKLSQNEWRTGNGDSTYRWEGEGWYGGNLNRAWFRSEGNLDTDTGTLDESEAQALYSRAVSPFFNLQAGVRYNFDPTPSRGWGAIGVEGLAPLFWEVAAFAFVSDDGHYAARVEGHYDLMLTQRLVLQPQFEVNLYTKSDARNGIGAGLSTLDSGLRLRYELTRQIAPYVGFTYEKKYGQTAGFARARDERVEDARVVVGLRAWF